MIIDTHSHLQFPAFDKDKDGVVKRSLGGGVWTINVGTNYETSNKAVELAEKYKEGVYAAVGLHPINLDTGLVKNRVDPNEGSHFEKDFDYQKYKELARSKKVVAIGEIGLDYYWKPKTKTRLEAFKKLQKELLLKQVALAQELGLPIIFHCRLAHEDLLKVLAPGLRGVVHSFTGTWAEARRFLDLGLYLGFNGIIFKKIEGINFEEIIKNTPIDRLLLETDCPYLTPPQEDGRNEPIYIRHIAKRIAEIKNINYWLLVEATVRNSRNIFRI